MDVTNGVEPDEPTRTEQAAPSGTSPSADIYVYELTEKE